MFNGHLDTSFAASEDLEILRAISPMYRPASVGSHRGRLDLWNGSV